MKIAVAPSDDVAFVLQAAALGGLLGTAVAAWLRRRNPDADTWTPSAVGALVFGSCAAIWALLDAVT